MVVWVCIRAKNRDFFRRSYSNVLDAVRHLFLIMPIVTFAVICISRCSIYVMKRRF